jgi:hypothetical protein
MPQDEASLPTTPGGPAPGAGDDISAKVFAAAKAFVGHDTSNAPGTDHGHLASAWSVNEVARLALGKPISGGGTNGLSIAELHDMLEAHHTRLSGAEQAEPGTIIMSPTVGSRHGHVGIVGATTGSVGDTQIFSNSSANAKFAQNFTIAKWKDHFVNLQVLFYQLKAGQF